MTRPTARRANGRPAYEGAKPRKRQSDYARPFMAEAMPEPRGWLAIFKRNAK